MHDNLSIFMQNDLALANHTNKKLKKNFEKLVTNKKVKLID